MISIFPLKIREKWVFDGAVCKNTLFYYEIDLRGGLCGKLCGNCGKLFKKLVAFATPVENYVENYPYCGKLCGKLLTMWKTSIFYSNCGKLCGKLKLLWKSMWKTRKIVENFFINNFKKTLDNYPPI